MVKDLYSKDLGMPERGSTDREVGERLIDSSSDMLVDSSVSDASIDDVDYFNSFLNIVSTEKDFDKRKAMVEELGLVDMDLIPDEVFRIYGCSGCDWRNTKRCPYHKNVERHTIHICNKRRFYLWYMTRDMKLLGTGFGTRKKFSMAQWTEGYLKNKLQMDLNNRHLELEKAINRLRAIEDELLVHFGKDERTDYNEVGKVSNNDFQQLEYLGSKRKELQGEYDDLIKYLIKSEQVDIDRNTPKDINLNVKNTVNISEIQRIINSKDKVVDADYEVLEEESKDE